MKNLIILTIFAASLLTACTCKTNSTENVVRHVVLFQWADDITPEKTQELVDHFASLKDKIDVIKDFEYGTDISVENLQKGYTHCFIVTFADAAGRDTYLPHPEHKKFGEAVTPYLKNVLVVDFVTQK